MSGDQLQEKQELEQESTAEHSVTDQLAGGAPAHPLAGTAGQIAPPFPMPPVVPTLKGPNNCGVRFDFNDGCRVMLPSKGDWRVVLRDAWTGNVLYDGKVAEGVIVSGKRYFVPFSLEVCRDGKSLFQHQYSAKGRRVLIMLPVGTLGDTMGWFPYAVKFQEKHECDLTVCMSALIIPLFEKSYPHIKFVTPEAVKVNDYYASYRIGLFFDDKDCIYQPVDFRSVGLHRTAAHILGVDAGEQRPLVSLDDDTRPIEEPYVCIATQASTQAKYWNHPEGWRKLVSYLKREGYRVVCIDQKATHGMGLIWNHLPHGCEDQTGDRPLQERARWLRHAAFFVGLSSGLSWLAWALKTPVVMVSGFTSASNEFETPYRVINYHTCNSCWNDPALRFDHRDFLWCPRHANTPRQFECTRLITPEHVENVIQPLCGSGQGQNTRAGESKK